MKAFQKIEMTSGALSNTYSRWWHDVDQTELATLKKSFQLELKVIALLCFYHSLADVLAFRHSLLHFSQGNEL